MYFRYFSRQIDFTNQRPAASAAMVKAGMALLALSVSPLVAHADDTTVLEQITIQGNDDNPAKTVVVRKTTTGSKTSADIADVPASVSVVTEKEMQERGVQNLQDVLAYTSSVSTDEFGSDDRYDYYRIRGFDQTALGTYRDGLSARIPAWFTASRVEPYGLERVDILKGSTSTLFGLNGPGGLVNAITKRPPDEFQAEAYTTFGKNHAEAGVDVGGPIDDEGVWKYRFTALAQDGDQGTDYSNDDRLYIAPALTISPEEGTSLTILTDYSKRNGTGARGYPMGVDIDTTSFLGEPDYNKFNTEQADIGYQFTHEITDGLTFRQNARFTHVGLNYEEVYGGTTNPSDDRTSFAVYGQSNRFAIDNQLEYDASWNAVDSKTLAGIDFTYDRTHENIFYGTADGIDIFNPVYCGRSCVHPAPYVNWIVDQKAVGIYGQEELTFDDRWILTLGGRYDHIDTKADYLLDGTSDHDTASAFTKRVGLTYKVTDGLSLYANYSESFQPLVSATANGYAVDGSLKPQEGRQYEAGVKYRPDSFDGLFTLAYFDLTQTNVPSYVSPSVQRQIGKVGVRGVEFEGKAALTDRMNLSVAYSYWDAEILEDGTGGNVGNRPSRVPKNIASAWFDYTIPGENRRGDLTLGGGVRYIGSTYGDDANTVKVDGHVVFDMWADYKVTENVSLKVSVTNLFDEKYASTCYYGTCYYGDRREIYGSLKYTW
ncbi:TonB-dependent siderophore receptor [Rhizobium sp. NRK18]|nr:TonB-dependent siderophore receptor [Rhizobium sp. NRK18]MCQ2006151.1 TonB-dependent siderophore receptor [Rhizobium sp. NRK18]